MLHFLMILILSLLLKYITTVDSCILRRGGWVFVLMEGQGDKAQPEGMGFKPCQNIILYTTFSAGNCLIFLTGS